MRGISVFGSELALLPDFNPIEKAFVRLYGSLSVSTIRRFLVFKHLALKYFKKEGLAHNKILDFGCAFGGFGFLLARKNSGAMVCLHDVNPDAENKCKLIRDAGKYNNVRYLCKNELTRESDFSLTLLGDVLEHIEDDRGTLEEIYTRTMPGGYLYITVPTSREKRSKLDSYHGHVRTGYTFEEIQMLLTQTGFRIVVSPEVRSANAPRLLSLMDQAYRKLTKFADAPCLDFHTLPKLTFRRKAALAFLWPFYRLAMELDIIAHRVQLNSIVVLAQK